MGKKLTEKIEKTKSETDQLHDSVLIASLTFSFFVALISFLAGKVLIAQGFLIGVAGSLIYLRMQVLFVKNLAKKDLLSILISMLSTGRILLIAAILFVAFKRTDLFDMYATICGLVSVHLISIFVFAYGISEKKKLVAKV
jgi:hypothetical protein